MKVNIGRFEYDTNDMSAYSTGNDKMPFIYVNHNRASFVQTVRRKAGPRHSVPEIVSRVRHIPRHEALRLAEFYKMEELKHRIQRASPVSELSIQDFHSSL